MISQGYKKVQFIWAGLPDNFQKSSVSKPVQPALVIGHEAARIASGFDQLRNEFLVVKAKQIGVILRPALKEKGQRI